jgi:hypothetical protein
MLHFKSFISTEHMKCAEPTALKWDFVSFFGGLKPTVTKLVEPTALLALKNLCINRSFQKDDDRKMQVKKI